MTSGCRWRGHRLPALLLCFQRLDSLPPASIHYHPHAVPFGTSQEEAYAAAYFLAALTLASCVIAVTLKSRRRSVASRGEGGGADVELSAPPAGDRVTLRHSDRYSGWAGGDAATATASSHASADLEAREKLKVEACITVVRCLGEVVLCVGLVASGSAISSGTTAQLILIIVAMEDGQGVHTFLLFGLSPLVLGAYGQGVRRVHGCMRRALSWLASLPSEAPSQVGRASQVDAASQGAQKVKLREEERSFFSAAAGTTTNPGW